MDITVGRPPAAPTATALFAASGLQERPNETDDAWTDVSEDNNGKETPAAQRQTPMAQIARLDPRSKRAKPAEPTLPSALAPYGPAPAAPVAPVYQTDEEDASPNSVPGDDAKVFYVSILAVPSTAYDGLPKYVVSRQKKKELYRQALYYLRSHPYRLDRQAERLKKSHGFNLDLVEFMKVLTGHHVSVVDADNPASPDLFYMFQTSSGANFYGIEAMIQSKAVLPKKTLTPAGHTEALMKLERLEGVVFNSHQGRDWHHYTRFLRELAKDPSLGFDFMVLYDNKFRRELADRSSQSTSFSK
ncbi:hypothetical protein MVLG_01144 [Microbotryum lychnidis-dioicae p1A1 Lamole]|uniref:Uncharacterized protein n=1 Tax=Microbotryum lychnidis-dioicae (strain p1A1 Lamole / MvSl-1064) TaxID=683840 RepID=U5H183_USTV1|nr:hypothetical protein MVLG_01144 [Microbotryum lychnidis-dioicae p1A1 Lamole]|eukprot:KDE08686.1 hypothetical protein MVLG_01144 [Microbotryum lychnidis-dioicae p1A1 Lamole]